MQKILCTAAILLVIGLAAIIGSLDLDSQMLDPFIAFQVCYGILLAIFGCIQLYVAITLYNNRNNLLLELYQPVWLALFALSGSIATFGSFIFALPQYDISCALRQPLLFVCFTFMGDVLVTRTWRIGCIMGVTQSFRVEDDNDDSSDQATTFITMSRLAIMKVLSKTSSWIGFIRSCGRKKSVSNVGIRRQITFVDSVWIVFVLMIPQIILQVVNLSLPNVRWKSEEIYDGGYDNIYICESDSGPWSLIVGIVLVIMPFLISLLLNTKGDGALPDQFRELDAMISSVVSSVCILIITLPSAALVKEIVPEVYMYLMGASVLSFVLPNCFHLAWKRVCVIKSQGTSATRTKRSSSNTTALDKDSEYTFARLKQAEDAATMSKMFETMGQLKKALEVSRGILTLFKSDGEFSWETEFDSSEVNTLGPKELEVVVSTMIDSAKRWLKVLMTKPGKEEEDEAQLRSVKACNDALNMFKEAPAKKLLKDRSVVFPGYSFMISMIKMGAYNPPDSQSLEEYECELACSFVKETVFQQYHHCRALAMKADMLRKHGRYEEAVAVTEEMKLVYDPHLHSKIILNEYSSDHCADILSAAVSWLCYVDRKEEALARCDCIIEEILPVIGEREFNSLTLVLYPIFLLYKDMGRDKATEALELYKKHVIQPTEGEKRHPVVANLIIPMTIILNCRSSGGGDTYVSMKDDISYVLNDEEEKYPAWLKASSVSYFDVSICSLYAEACLCLSRMNECNKEAREALLKEGHLYLDLSDASLKTEDGNITSTLAYSHYSRILSDIKQEG